MILFVEGARLCDGARRGSRSLANHPEAMSARGSKRTTWQNALMSATDQSAPPRRTLLPPVSRKKTTSQSRAQLYGG